MDLKKTLLYYYEGLPKKDLLHLEARACIVVIEKMIEENEIFASVKPKAAAIIQPKQQALQT